MPIIEWPALYDQPVRYLSGATLVLGVSITALTVEIPPPVDLSGPLSHLRVDAGPVLLRADTDSVRLRVDAWPLRLRVEG